MNFKDVLKKVVHFVEVHGASKVLDAIEGVVDLGLDDLVAKVPAEFKLLAKTANTVAQDRLTAEVKKVEAKLSEVADGQ